MGVLSSIIKEKSREHGLNPDIVACIVIQESGGELAATRFEPNFYKKYLENKELRQLSGWTPNTPGSNGQPSIATEKFLRACSFGLMQVMGESARSIAKYENPWLTNLLINTSDGIDVGCRILKHCLKRCNGNIVEALAAYNAGNPAFALGREYAKKVMSRYNKQEYKFILD